MIRTHALQWGSPGRPLTPPLDLSLAAGSLTAVLGPNGSGKSSLLQVLAGFRRPLQGSFESGARTLGAVAYLPQQQLLDRQYPMDLATLVGAGLWRSQASKAEQRKVLRESLGQWQLTGLERRPLGVLSGGELQRGLLARIALQDASLLLLDEPESALDEAGKAIFWAQLKVWQQQGRTILVVCHDHPSVRQHFSQALLISPFGCILGSPDTVLRSPAGARYAA